METNKCKKCGEVKTLDNFYKSETSKLGVINVCKECRRKSQRKGYNNFRIKNLDLAEKRMGGFIIKVANTPDRQGKSFGVEEFGELTTINQVKLKEIIKILRR